MIDLDHYVLQSCVATWGGHRSTYTPLPLLSVFDDKYREEALQSMAGVVIGTRPMLTR